MGMTISEKILAEACRKDFVRAGEIVEVEPNFIMSNDATTHVSIDIFEKQIKNKKIKYPEKVVFVIDHNVPTNDIKTANIHKKMKDFAGKHNINNFYDGKGICHQLLLEKHVFPGQIVIGADSHTCTMGALGAFGTGLGSTDIVAAMVSGKTWFMVPETIRVNLYNKLSDGVYHRDVILKVIGELKSDGATYDAIEFGGPAVREMSVEQRMVLCNMAVEAGAKTGIVEPDDKVNGFLKKHNRLSSDFKVFNSDSDAVYKKVLEFDLSEIKPAVTLPDFVDNYSTIDDVVNDKIQINQGFIGSCNNGRIENLREAANILNNRKVNSGVKLFVSPASQKVYKEALNEGLLDILIESGAVILNPSCSACWGGCQGVIGDKEVSISTGTRNFKGRTGSPSSKVYLASSATVAASSINGYISDPREF